MSCERQPEYLELDSPALQGNAYILDPSPVLFSIPANQLSSKDIKHIPKSPRSRRILSVLRKHSNEVEQQATAKKEEEMELRMRMKFVNEARKIRTETMRHSQTKFVSTPKLVQQEESPRTATVSTTAKAFLHAASNPTRTAGNHVTRSVDNKVGEIRAGLHMGHIRLNDLRQQAPCSPKPSHAQSSRMRSALGVPYLDPIMQSGFERDQSEDLVQDEEQDQPNAKLVGKQPPTVPPVRQFVVTGLALKYLQNLRRIYDIKHAIAPFENDPHAIACLVRLQRWLTHTRFKRVFFAMLRHRRIIFKALQRYAVRFKIRYRNMCASIILDFFRVCFEEAGLRMAMKIFRFRVVRLQRVMRTFLVCTRARQQSLLRCLQRRKVIWNEPKRERTMQYISNVAPELLLTIVRRHRKTYSTARAAYMRLLRAGDLMSASFQPLTIARIRNFLATPSAASEEPPQYAGGTMRPPCFVLFSRECLAADFEAMLDLYEKRATLHARRLVKDLEARRRQEESDEAVRNGRGHEYQLAQMQVRNSRLEQPAERLQLAMQELGDFERFKKRQNLNLLNAHAKFEQEQRKGQAELQKLYDEHAKKLM